MAWGMRNIVISLFGSSIMEGRIGVECFSDRYYAILQRKLSERFPDCCFSIINGAIGGKSTRELMSVFDENVLKYSPDYCLFMAGANNMDMNRKERILKPGELEELMEQFEKRLAPGCKRIGVVLNPVIDHCHFTCNDPAWQEVLEESGGFNALLEKERDKARTFYAKYKYPVIDLAKLMAHDPSEFVLETDGIHLSPSGHRLFADAAFELLEKIFEKDLNK